MQTFITSKSKQILVIIVTMMLSLAVLGMAGSVYAQNSSAQQICEGSGGTWNGSECINPNAEQGLFGDGSVFQSVVNTLLFIVGAISVIMLIVGGIRYVVSAGDSNAVQGAKNTILYSIVGIVVSFMAYAIVNFILNSLSS